MKVNTKIIDSANYRFLSNSDIVALYEYIKSSADYYKDIDCWFFNKVLPGISTGERTIITFKYNNYLAGLAIIKHTHLEKKICTLKIGKPFQKIGLGYMLFEKCFELLNTEKPLATVSAELLGGYVRILDFYGFKLENVLDNNYRATKSMEYVYNGELATETPVHTANDINAYRQLSLERFLP